MKWSINVVLPMPRSAGNQYDRTLPVAPRLPSAIKLAEALLSRPTNHRVCPVRARGRLRVEWR